MVNSVDLGHMHRHTHQLFTGLQESAVNIQIFLESSAFSGCALSEVMLIPEVVGIGVKSQRAHA